MAQRLDYQHRDKPEQTEKEIETTIQWLKGYIPTKELAKQLKCSQPNVYQWLAPRLRLAYQLKKLKVK